MGLGAGQIPLDTDFDEIEQASNQKPLIRLVANATQSIADNTATALTFATEDIDTDGFHSTSVNTSRVTPTVAGYYRFYGTVFMGGRTDYSTISVVIRKNGSTNMAPAGRVGGGASFSGAAASAQVCSVPCDVLVDMNGTTDYIELVVTQDNVANVSVSTNQSSQFSSTLQGHKERDL